MNDRLIEFTKTIFENKRKLFWFLNIFGWLFFVFGWGIPGISNNISLIMSVLGLIFAFIFYFSLSLLLRSLFRFFKRITNRFIIIVTLVLLSVCAVSTIYVSLDYISSAIRKGYEISSILENKRGVDIILRILNVSLIFGFWSTLYYSINLFYTLKDEKLNKERALLQASEFRMEVLKNQINPHFLFNSLNSISALIEEDKTKAQKMIDELSDFLRFTLLHKHDHVITLEEELKFIRHYVHIQVIRFESKLECVYNIDPGTLKYFIIPAILYPLVENAIKHGMNTSKLPLKIVIESYTWSNQLIICIRNSGYWIETKISDGKSTHTGLENVRERLRCTYGDKASIVIIKKDGQVELKLEIPTEYQL